MAVLNRRNLFFALLILGLLALLLASAFLTWGKGDSTAELGSSQEKTSSAPPLPVPEPMLIKPLAPEQAVAINEGTPISSEPIEAARPFRFGVDPTSEFSRSAASDCLTAAVYYEAGSESEQGQRAVAQVILNRSRHPAFPNSVCGVVYQGSERRTGCQFTFTCDGSLARKPSSAGWARAKRIAIDALSGKVEVAVGMATHYHANYVVPYWAPSLLKISAIGTHIFYRWNGYWGKRQAFTQTYGGEVASRTHVDAALVVDGDRSEQQLKPELTSPALNPLADSQGALLDVTGSLREPVASTLRADEGGGALKLDQEIRTLAVDAPDPVN